MPETETHGQPLTDRPNFVGRIVRGQEARRLELAGRLESDHEVLDRLVGVENVVTALANMVIERRRRVLWSGTAVIGASGMWHRRLPQGSAAISVINFSANDQVIVAAGPPAGNAPGAGAGTHLLPAGCFAVFNDDTADWTLYGTTGDSFDVQIFSIPITPAAAGQI